MKVRLLNDGSYGIMSHIVFPVETEVIDRRIKRRWGEELSVGGVICDRGIKRR